MSPKGFCWMAAVWTLCLASGPVGGADVFRFGFDGPTSLRGKPGELASATFFCTLSQEGSGPGAEAWSIAVAAEEATIAYITVGNTDAKLKYRQGSWWDWTAWEAKASSPCEGKSVAASAVILSRTEPITLDPSVVSSIAMIHLETRVQDPCRVVKLFYTDGCKVSGKVVENLVTQGGVSVKPVLEAREIPCLPPERSACRDQALNVGFSAHRLSGRGDMSSVLGDEDGAGGVIPVSTLIDGRPGAEAFVTVVSHWRGFHGIQGWTLSVALSGDGDLVGATLEGTSAALVPEGFFENGFAVVELVDPALEPASGPLAGKGPQGQGVVSGVVLGLLCFAELPPDGVESILKLTVAPAQPEPYGETRCRLYFRDGLQLRRYPATNEFSVVGKSRRPCNLDYADVTLSLSERDFPRFLRGDPNDDGRVDIADAIWIAQELFFAGPPTLCARAADANGDGALSVSDALSLLAYQLLGGPPPSPPFPDCGWDPDGPAESVACEVPPRSCR